MPSDCKLIQGKLYLFLSGFLDRYHDLEETSAVSNAQIELGYDRCEGTLFFFFSLQAPQDPQRVRALSLNDEAAFFKRFDGVSIC